jgi:hypothetical protein
MNGLARKLTDFFGSRRFWYVLLVFFVLEALWFVFSAVYPMAFDEDFHLGVIRIYADQWSPFLHAHPAGADQFGAVARDPSYFFHYLMSFPYRVVAHLTGSEAVQVICLRLLNVALFTTGLVLFRKVMLRAKASPAFTQVALAIFILIPIVPQLAAHINYDNLIMVLLPLLCLVTFRIMEAFRKHTIPVLDLLYFVALGLGICVVKYAALPFLLAAVIFLGIVAFQSFRGHIKTVPGLVRSSFKTVHRPALVVVLLICGIGAVLFSQRYAVNVARYHTLVPDCGQVLSVQQCSAYGPWGRDYYFEQVKPVDFQADPLRYMSEWSRGMWFRLFFAVNGPASVFTNYRPLPVPAGTAIILATIALACSLLWCKSIFRRNPYLIFFGILIGLYIVALWIDQYGMYKQTAQPVAINGRYLLPILPLLALIFGEALRHAFRYFKVAYLKPFVAALVLLLFLHGGGVFTFILRSDDTWYWPKQSVRTVNHAAQKILAPITIEGAKW